MSDKQDEVIDHYEASGYEADRLDSGVSQLERVRTKEILERFLPPSPAAIVDVGGGTGHYSFWLAGKGYEVHLIDVTPLHIKLAKQKMSKDPKISLASCKVGDAKNLDRKDQSADCVLLMGPLYHLQDKSDRMKVLRDAHRILKPNGLVFCAVISRFASALDGMKAGRLNKPEFWKIVQEDLQTGRHNNPTNHPDYFTTAYFHHPEELKEEMEAAGFAHQSTLGLEGPACILADFEEQWSDPQQKEKLIELARLLESKHSMMGCNYHMLGIGIKKD